MRFSIILSVHSRETQYSYWQYSNHDFRHDKDSATGFVQCKVPPVPSPSLVSLTPPCSRSMTKHLAYLFHCRMTFLSIYISYQSLALHDCILLGLPDNIAVRCDLLPKMQSQVVTARSGYYWSDAKGQLAQNLDPRIFVHTSSAVHKLRYVSCFIVLF